SKFSMTIYFWGHAVQLVYQRALYAPERMRNLLDQLKFLIEQIVAAPEKPLLAYSLVSQQSRSVLPDPSIGLGEPRYELMTEMFLSWARKSPEQPAVYQKGRIWTYHALSDSAHQIASALLSKGLESGDVVAVLGPSSFGLISSAMATFLCRGALLLLDRNLPVNRLRFMLQEANVKHILYTGPLRPDDQWIKMLTHINIHYLDPNSGQMIGERYNGIPKSRNSSGPTPEDAAYISFTSGTTGVPKGILGSHKGLSHFLTWQRTTFDIGPGDRVAQ